MIAAETGTYEDATEDDLHKVNINVPLICIQQICFLPFPSPPPPPSFGPCGVLEAKEKSFINEFCVLPSTLSANA